MYPPRLPDAVLPFLFGAAEVYQLRSVPTRPADWWLGFAGLALVGLMAYVNMAVSASRVRANDRNWSYMRRQLVAHIGICVATVLGTLLIARLQPTMPWQGALAVAFVLGYVVIDEVMWSRLPAYAERAEGAPTAGSG